MPGSLTGIWLLVIGFYTESIVFVNLISSNFDITLANLFRVVLESDWRYSNSHSSEVKRVIIKRRWTQINTDNFVLY